MQILKMILSGFLLVLCVMIVLGFLWWGQPPEKLASYATGGRVILAVTFAGCLVGLWELWRSGKVIRA